MIIYKNPEKESSEKFLPKTFLFFLLGIIVQILTHKICLL